MLTATNGEAVMAHRFTEYKPWKGVIPGRMNGVMFSTETGVTTAYSIDKLQDRGTFFVDPGEEVYVGQIMGEQIRPGDLGVNIVRGKALTNMRASGKDDSAKIAPKLEMSLEQAMEYIQADETLEITPKIIRLRKAILDEHERKRQEKSVESMA